MRGGRTSKTEHGVVAQWLERRSYKAVVAGSIPANPTLSPVKLSFIRFSSEVTVVPKPNLLIFILFTTPIKVSWRLNRRRQNRQAPFF